MHIRNSLKQQLCYREPTETLAYENVLSLQGQYPRACNRRQKLSIGVAQPEEPERIVMYPLM